MDDHGIKIHLPPSETENGKKEDELRDIKKSLLQEIEESNTPRQEVDLASLCNRKPGIYGQPASRTRRQLQYWWQAAKRRPIQSYIGFLASYGVIRGKATESELALELLQGEQEIIRATRRAKQQQQQEPQEPHEQEEQEPQEQTAVKTKQTSNKKKKKKKKHKKTMGKDDDTTTITASTSTRKADEDDYDYSSDEESSSSSSSSSSDSSSDDSSASSSRKKKKKKKSKRSKKHRKKKKSKSKSRKKLSSKPRKAERMEPPDTVETEKAFVIPPSAAASPAIPEGMLSPVPGPNNAVHTPHQKSALKNRQATPGQQQHVFGEVSALNVDNYDYVPCATDYQDGTLEAPWIIIVCEDFPERHRGFDVQKVSQIVHQNWQREGYHVRCHVATPDVFLWSATVPKEIGAGRVIRVKQPSQDYWLRDIQVYHHGQKETSARVNCKSTETAHKVTQTAITANKEARFWAYTDIVFPQRLDNQIFSGNETKITMRHIPVKIPPGHADNKYKKDLTSTVIFWRIAIKGLGDEIQGTESHEDAHAYD